MLDNTESLANEWHPTKNGKLQFEDFSSGSGKKVWWLGTCGHEWQSEFRSRTRKGAGCPVCCGRLTIPGVNDLATFYPEIAAEWHPTKNGNSRPEDCARFSTKVAWWLGECGHEWKTPISSRTSMHSGCPYCANYAVLAGFNDLKTRFPGVAEEWHTTKNGHVGPESISPGSKRSYWWICELGHEWEAPVTHRAHSGNGCPNCAGRRVLAGVNDLATTHPSAASLWHPTKNGLITPQEITAGSNKKYWWLGLCGHEWEASIGKITSGRRCPMCRGLKVLPGFNDLASRSPELAAEWHPTKNGKLGPDDVTYGSGKKVWWSGPCGHEWEAAIVLRTNAGTGCPFCRGLQIKVGDNDFASKYPDVATEWHPTKNGSLLPTDITSGVNLKVWWFGKCGHEWRANVSSRSQGHGCPLCVGRVSKPELELFNQLSEMVEDLRLNVMLHAPWGTIRQRQWARCDMVSDDLGVVVEYDGWFYHRNQLDIDVAKTEALIRAGWLVIRVRANGHYPQDQLSELPNLPGLFTVHTRHGAGGQADAEMVFDVIARQLSAGTPKWVQREGGA